MHYIHRGIYCYVQDDGKNYMTDITQTLNNVKEIYDQITEDDDAFFIIDKWKKSLQLCHDELYNKIYDIEA
jgi:predicted AlkP superfamily pyrophosphatase or phosphodiesterase